jgi:hypothetical protein
VPVFRLLFLATLFTSFEAVFATARIKRRVLAIRKYNPILRFVNGKEAKNNTGISGWIPES